MACAEKNLQQDEEERGGEGRLPEFCALVIPKGDSGGGRKPAICKKREEKGGEKEDIKLWSSFPKGKTSPLSDV